MNQITTETFSGHFSKLNQGIAQEGNHFDDIGIQNIEDHFFFNYNFYLYIHREHIYTVLNYMYMLTYPS